MIELMKEYEVWLKGRVNLTVHADSPEEAKQVLADALYGWDVSVEDCEAEEVNGDEK